MQKKFAPQNILITFDISSIAGRDQLAGVFRFLRTKPNWLPRLISRPQDFTPEIVRNATSEQIDGIIINHAGSPETEDALAHSDIPLAVIGIRNPKLVSRTNSIALIRNDNKETGRQAAKYLLSLGNFRSFGFIPAVPQTAEWSVARESGFRAALALHRAELFVFRQNATAGTRSVWKSLSQWLHALPKPAAILGAWDYPAVQALEICRREGIRIPQEVAIIGVDNDPMICEASVPPLTSIPFAYEQEGYESAAALAQLIERKRNKHHPITVSISPSAVVVRESDAAIAPASQLIKRAQRFIEQNAHKGISTKDVASAMGVSQSLLSLRFREFSDETVLAALIRIRLEKTKQLLAETSRSISHISAACGFRNPNYLKNLFRRRVGMSMRDYRKLHRTPDSAS